MLALLADLSEPLWACDLFRAQQLNVDRSGRGNETAFLDAVRRHARRSDVQLFRGASHRLWYERIAPPPAMRTWTAHTLPVRTRSLTVTPTLTLTLTRALTLAQP